MGLFGKKDVCTICNKNESNKKIQNGNICKDCIKKCYPFINTLSWRDITTEKINKAILLSQENQKLVSIFQPTKKVEKYISFDENNKLWKANTSDVIFRYDDIISYELLEDGESVTKGGLGSAVVGGALLGGTGALVGGVTGAKKTKKEIDEFRIKVITRNELYPDVYINFLMTGKVKSGSILYKSYKGAAQNILSEFAIIADKLGAHKSEGVSNADELRKYKGLLDDGVITQEEFEAKKKQLLGL